MTDNDPFAAAQVPNPTAAAPAASNTPAPAMAGGAPDDPFALPSSVSTSDYPKFEELYGKLLVMQPTKLENVPDINNPGKMKDRMTTDVTVIDPMDPAKSRTYTDMYVSNAIVGKLKLMLPLRKMLVGVLRRGKSQQTPAGINTPEEVDAALAKNPRLSFAWFLEDPSPEQMNLIRAWYASK